MVLYETELQFQILGTVFNFYILNLIFIKRQSNRSICTQAGVSHKIKSIVKNADQALGKLYTYDLEDHILLSMFFFFCLFVLQEVNYLPHLLPLLRGENKSSGCNPNSCNLCNLCLRLLASQSAYSSVQNTGKLPPIFLIASNSQYGDQ